MTMCVAEAQKLERTPEYNSGVGLWSDIRRYNMERALEADLAKQLGAWKVEIDRGYTRIYVGRKMPQMYAFSGIEDKARANDSRVKIRAVDKRGKEIGFEIRNLFGKSELLKVVDESNPIAKRTKLEFSNNCLETECYKDMVDEAARILGLNV
jgi:hypothetical protein